MCGIDVGGLSPWGRVECVERVAPGIKKVWAENHSGFFLSAGKACAIRNRHNFRPAHGDQWFEWVADSSVVVLAFPEFFGAVERLNAARMVARDRNYFGSGFDLAVNDVLVKV